MRDCYVIYTCNEWKNTSSIRLEYIVEDRNDIFRALRNLVNAEKIEVEPFPDNLEAATNYLYIYQNNMNKVFNGKIDLSDLNSRLRYCSVQKFVVGF